MLSWDQLYSLIGIKDFIYFISSPSIQDAVFPVKLVFIFFTAFFFCAVMWFYVNSSYIQYKFLQDTSEFLSHETYGLRKVNRNFKKILKRLDAGTESESKLAIIEADDYLTGLLDQMGYKGDTFEELIANAQKKLLDQSEQILKAHEIRNAIVYDLEYAMDFATAKKLILVYENAIKSIMVA